MTIDISDLNRKKILKKDVHLILEPGTLLVEDEDVLFSEPVKLDITISSIGEILNLDGKLSAELVFTCSRCLESFTYHVDLEIHEKFSNKLNDNDEDIILFDSESINITNIIENNIVMALPMKKLCNEECKGLCPNCGTNLNIHSCNCNNSDIDIRLAELKNLFSTK